MTLLVATLVGRAAYAYPIFQQDKVTGRDQFVVDSDTTEVRSLFVNSEDERGLMMALRIGRKRVVDASDYKQQHEMLIIWTQAARYIFFGEIGADTIFSNPHILGELFAGENRVAECYRRLPERFIAGFNLFFGQRASINGQLRVRPHSEGWSIAYVSNYKGYTGRRTIPADRKATSPDLDAVNASS